MRRTMGLVAGLAVALLVLVVLPATLYTVSETEQVIITQFGRPVGEVVREAGLHARVPFVQKVNRFEKRVMEWDGFPNQIPTRDKKYIHVDTFARWRIDDPLLFLRSVANEDNAQTRLDDILDGAARNVITEQLLIEVVRNSNREFPESEETEEVAMEEELGIEIPAEIQTGRDALAQRIAQEAAPVVAKLGIELLDVRIKRVNYVKEVAEKVYDRMIAERNRIAEKFRSEGRGIRAEWLGRKERDLKRIESEAYRQAQEIRGQADGEATAIYAAAFGQDEEFYSLWMTLDTYRQTVDSSTTLIVAADSPYFRFLAGGEKLQGEEGAEQGGE